MKLKQIGAIISIVIYVVSGAVLFIPLYSILKVGFTNLEEATRLAKEPFKGPSGLFLV